jgi:hypothetical protein
VEDYQLLLEDAGFSIDEIFSDEFILSFNDGTTMFNHFLIRLAFMESWKSLLPEEKCDEIFSLIEDRLNQIAENKNSLVLTIPFFLFNCEKSRD